MKYGKRKKKKKNKFRNCSNGKSPAGGKGSGDSENVRGERWLSLPQKNKKKKKTKKTIMCCLKRFVCWNGGGELERRESNHEPRTGYVSYPEGSGNQRIKPNQKNRIQTSREGEKKNGRKPILGRKEIKELTGGNVESRFQLHHWRKHQTRKGRDGKEGEAKEKLMKFHFPCIIKR